MMICAVLLAAGGVVSWLTIRDTVLDRTTSAAARGSRRGHVGGLG